MLTITDKKIPVATFPNDEIIDYFTADVVTANDYYPGGMLMPGRKYQASSGSYRFGFNGQEKSDDVIVGNFTAEFWEYDSRIGRRWNIDPRQKVNESPYMCFSGNPIFYSDLLGDSTVPTPNGGTIDLPKEAKIIGVYTAKTSTLEGDSRLVNVKEGSISSFQLNDDKYEVMFSTADGSFVGYGKNRSPNVSVTPENSVATQTHTEWTKPSTSEANSIFVFGMRSSAATVEFPPVAAAGAITTTTLTALAFVGSALIIVTTHYDLKMTIPFTTIGGWFVYSKGGTSKPLSNLPQTLAGLEALRGEIKQRQTANNGKLTAVDKALLGNIVTQEKYLGQRNKANDNRKKK